MPIISSGNVQGLTRLPIQEGVLLMLEKLFPPLVATTDTTINEVMYAAGQQHIIRFLRQHYEATANTTGI